MIIQLFYQPPNTITHTEKEHHYYNLIFSNICHCTNLEFFYLRLLFVELMTEISVKIRS